MPPLDATMICQQCSRPAFYQVGNEAIPLCLDCWSKLEETNFRKFLMSAAMANQALDDMNAVTGLSGIGGRIPVAAIASAFRRSSVYNNITVTNSQIGVINTGDLAKIDAAITMTAGSDADAIGRQLRDLTQTVLDARDVAADQKRELIELIQALSEQVVSGRKKSVVLSLLHSIEERAKGANAIIQLVGPLITSITQLFG
jgi:signal transduction histidine kinase